MTMSLLFYLTFLYFVLATTSAENVCDVCKGLNVTKPYMVINMLYLGVISCKNLYKAGMNGQIPRHLCDPLQYFAFEPCGCSVLTNFKII